MLAGLLALLGPVLAAATLQPSDRGGAPSQRDPGRAHCRARGRIVVRVRAVFKTAEQQLLLEGERRRMMRDMHDGPAASWCRRSTWRAMPGRAQSAAAGRDDPAGAGGAAPDARLRSSRWMATCPPSWVRCGCGSAFAGSRRHRARLAGRGDRRRSASLTRGVMHLFRCVQEILANVVKHARARRVRVRPGRWRRQRPSGDRGRRPGRQPGSQGRGSRASLHGRGPNNIRNRVRHRSVPRCISMMRRLAWGSSSALSPPAGTQADYDPAKSRVKHLDSVY